MITCRYKLTPDQTVVGDPIDVVTGASLDTQTDFALAGPLPIRWHRNYDSGKSAMPGSLGWGQFHEFDRRLVFDLDGMRYVGPTGDVVGFPYLDRDGQSSSLAGVTVRRVTARQYVVQTPGDPLATYDLAAGRTFAPLTAISRGTARVAFGYDQDGLLHSVTDSTGRTIRAENDAFGRLSRLTLQDGSRSRRLAEYQYDSAGNLVRMTDPYGHSFQSRFDRDHRQVQRIDRRGYAFQFEYDPAGRCVRAGGHDGTDEVRLKYDPELRMTVVTKRDGGDWTFFYNDTGVVTRILAPDGGIAQFNRDETGRVAEEVDPLGNKTRRVFNAAGAIEGRIDPLGRFVESGAGPVLLQPSDWLATTPAEWDYGILLPGIAADFPQFRGADTLAADPAAVPHLPPPAPEGSVTEADEFGNVYRDTFPDDTQRRWVHDANGNVTKSTDREGQSTTCEYTGWNMLAAETDPLGGRVRFRYTAFGETSAVIDANGTLTEYEHDAAERLVAIRRHGVVRETYERDVAGNLVRKRAGDGGELYSVEIGAKNLPAVRRYASGDTHEFKYDEAGRCVAATSTAGAVVLEYDEDGLRIVDVRDGLGVVHAPGLTASVVLGRYRYGCAWEDGDKLVVTDPTGGPHTIRILSPTLVERRLGNGVVETTRYDAAGRCHARVRTGLGGDWVRRYRYSPEGDLRAASDSLGGETTYRYDAAHRVSGVQRPDAPFEPIDHDIGNNVLRMPGLSGVRLLDGNRLQSANGETIEYDKRNHLAVRRVGTVETRYHYDERDLLMKVEKTEQPDWTATYDPFGRRVRKQWGVGKWVEYFWDTDRLIAERNETGRVRVYVYADPSALMPMLFVEYPDAETDTAAGKRYYVFADQIGTPTRVEDDAGAVAWSARIDPYGRTTVDPGNRIDFDFRFPGHWFDAETGLHSNRYRSYDPALGRYLQSDPLGVAGGMNLYAYCGGNPLVRVDVKGLADDLTDKQRDVYNDLRGSTPSDKNRADCNKGGSTCALTGETPPAKPGGEKGVLAADHVVPFKEIVKLKGFTELTREQQLAIANNPENFQPLLKGVNSSKGGKEVEDWKTLRGEDITTGKEGKARAAMLEKAEESKKALLAQIKQFEKEKEEAKQKNKKPCKK